VHVKLFLCKNKRLSKVICKRVVYNGWLTPHLYFTHIYIILFYSVYMSNTFNITISTYEKRWLINITTCLFGSSKIKHLPSVVSNDFICNNLNYLIEDDIP